MADSTFSPAGDMQDAAKRRMERWLLSPELREHLLSAKDIKRPAKTGAYIAISREAGAGGLSIARVVGQQLGWDVLDKELLEFMGERYNMPRDMLEIVDETKANWFYDVLGTFLDARLVSHDSFVYHLERIVYLAALYGNVVFVGRGAHFLLPRESGLAVRVIKAKNMRVETLMRRRNLGRPEAANLADELDQHRREFCQRHFHHDVEDPAGYDLVINSTRISDQAAGQLIVDAFSRAQRDQLISDVGLRKN